MIIFALYSFQGFKLNNDFWFLIKTGETILKEGFINIETFTIHSGLTFIPQQWLTDIIFYFIYSNLGIRGMYFLVLSCGFIIAFLLFKMCLLVANDRKKAVFNTIISIIFLLLWSDVLTTRPQLFDAISFTLELFLLESFIKKNKTKYLYFIPVISVLLINYHASMWIMLFVLMIPYYVEYIILKCKNKPVNYSIKPLLISTIISLLIGFINPYGIDAIKYLINSYGISKINNLVLEMHAVEITDVGGRVVFMIIFLLLYSFYYNKNENRIRYFLLCIGLSYLALSHYKGIIFLGIVIPLILGYNFRNRERKLDIKLRMKDKIIYTICMIVLLELVIIQVPLKDGVKIKEFADYLDQNASHDIKLYTNYDDGSYMEYRGYKCYIDPRAEVFLKANNHVEDIFDEYYDLEIGVLDPKEFLNKYMFDYLLVSSDSYMLFNELKNNSEYVEVFSKKLNDSDNITKYLYKRVIAEKDKRVVK